jgi:hypothetical protein
MCVALLCSAPFFQVSTVNNITIICKSILKPPLIHPTLPFDEWLQMQLEKQEKHNHFSIGEIDTAYRLGTSKFDVSFYLSVSICLSADSDAL